MSNNSKLNKVYRISNISMAASLPLFCFLAFSESLETIVKIARRSRLRKRSPFLCVMLSGFLTGCTLVGPATVHSGRLAYNESIVETNNQQLLLLVLRNRYGERGNLLALNSVTANVSVTAKVSTQLGFGNSADYLGNLVPFGAGVIYEENPTIFYSPVGGEKYADRLMSPLSLRELILFASNLTDSARVYFTFLSRINGIHNPSFLYDSNPVDPRFSRLIELFSKLDNAQRLHWTENLHSTDRYSIVIDHYWPDYSSDVAEVYKLLDLPAPEIFSSRLEIPVSLGPDYPVEGGISISTRSIYNLLEILSAATDVPEQDLVAHRALSYPPLGLVGQKLRVRRDSVAPEDASTAVQYRDAWYYIDDTNQNTKLFFRLVTTLMSVSIADSTSGDAGPLLTVPVSK